MKQPNKAQKTKKVDSKETSAIAERYPLFSKETALCSFSKEKVDCHADFQSARNDRKNTPSKKRILATTPHSHCETSAGSRGNPKKADSRRNAKNASEQPKDSRKTAQNLKATILQTPQNKQAEVVFDSESQAADSAKSAQKPTPKQTTTSTDILTCLANLSTDEVFTPPHIVNAMLDLLPQELFSDPSATFLDPACKSGVFLREIARRLMLGLEPHFPEPSKRIAHILTHQLYGIAITELTALLSRRTLYGSKDVDNHRYSIPKKAGAALPQGGNIYYAPTPHSFKNAKCTYCGASQSQYDRDSTLESYAYAFIHELEPLEKFFAKAKAHFPSLQAVAKAIQPQSSLRGSEATEAIHKNNADSRVDCHALSYAKARNDSKKWILGETPESKQQLGGRIWVIESWLCKGRLGSYLSGDLRQSRKAQSTSPKPNKERSTNDNHPTKNPQNLRLHRAPIPAHQVEARSKWHDQARSRAYQSGLHHAR